MRSLLFVPGDRPDRMEKALSAGADALILDLEDSVTPANKKRARAEVTSFLKRCIPGTCRLFVRINPLGSSLIDDDLEAVLPGQPFGIVLPKADGGQSIIELNRKLIAFKNTQARILPIATETPAAVFALGTFGSANKRMCGLTWGAEDLPACVGASSSREENGSYTPPYELVRSLALFGAHAAEVPAIETIFPNLSDETGLLAYAARARRDGFSGMLAIHPNQISAINSAFTPSESEIRWARQVVAAFLEHPGEGALQLDGKMLDAPHLKAAQALLTRASS